MHDRHIKFLLIMPAFALVTLTILYPLGYAVSVSFMDWRLSRSRAPTDFVGLQNYVRAFTDDPSFWNSMQVTIIFVLGSVLGAVFFALLIALLLSRQGTVYSITRSIVALPFAMSPALQGTSFRFFLNPEFGIFDRIIDKLLPFAASIDWLGSGFWAMTWLIITDIWNWAPFLSLMMIAGLLSIPKETLDAAAVDGASSWKRFWTIILPLLAPVLAITCVLKAIFSFKMFEYVYLLTGGGPGEKTSTMTFYAYRQGFVAYDMGYSSAVAVLLAVLLVFVSLVYFRLIFPKDGET
ncbi:carbohydrate ABC transporter permease [Shimia sediminis]|uniref:carbohydrate ABC transporter permease n=1 Tax=Shimia sediminis TaxID=2497945 RepID=UPI000F8EEE27|nr:sugar ABC transporter permease [Shimia sediminis]